MGACKAKGAPKYKRAGHFLLLQLATSCATPSKTRNSTLSPCMLTVAIKLLLVQTAPEDGPVEVVLGAPLGGIPL